MPFLGTRKGESWRGACGRETGLIARGRRHEKREKDTGGECKKLLRLQRDK